MKIILFGANGKMGKSVVSLVKEPDEIVCGVDPASDNAPFPVYSNCNEITEQADVCIDFSVPQNWEERLTFCESRRLPLVLATTGFSAEEEQKIRYYARHNTIFKSENFSFCVNLLRILAQKAAKALKEFDAEIVEKHHAQKKDAPSGTALLLAKSVNEGFGGTKKFVFGRGAGARKKNELGIHSVRGGTVTGEHEIFFFGENETLALSHSAHSRAVFAAGALKAAAWIIGKPAGLYSMENLCVDILR